MRQKQDSVDWGAYYTLYLFQFIRYKLPYLYILK